ncbi:MAG TPA: hypothetical protein VKA55_07000 [Gammaproteobacteria bacterium]|nr:hypothetical protein [Gammaproteobacteria bacterium]
MKEGDQTPLIPGDLRWAMVYHQGLPVATCPVASVTDERVELMCGPLRFERNAELAVSLSRDRDGGRLAEDLRVLGQVEEIGSNRLALRIRAGAASD